MKKEIPQTVQEVIEIVSDSFLNDKNTLDCIKSEDEDSFAAKSNTFLLGDGLAMKIRNDFELWNESSPIVNEFKEDFKIDHPDDMSDYILRKSYQKIKSYD